jgi:hypothetical protein
MSNFNHNDDDGMYYLLHSKNQIHCTVNVPVLAYGDVV